MGRTGHTIFVHSGTRHEHAAHYICRLARRGAGKLIITQSAKTPHVWRKSAHLRFILKQEDIVTIGVAPDFGRGGPQMLDRLWPIALLRRNGGQAHFIAIT